MRDAVTNVPESQPKGDGRDEMNLVEFPLSVLCSRRRGNEKTFTVTHEVRDQTSGEIVQRSLMVTGTDKFGLPTAVDEQVIVGLIQLSYRSGFSDRKVYFSRYELAEVLGWPKIGKTYRKLRESLYRLSGVQMIYENSWWCKGSKSWKSCVFHLLDGIVFSEESGRSGDRTRTNGEGKSYFVWDEIVFQSFKAGYVKPLDMELFRKVSKRNVIGMRLLRLLDKRFYHGPVCEFDLKKLGHEFLGLSEKYHPSQIKREILRGIAPLEAEGYLEPLGEKQFSKTVDGRHRAVFKRKVERKKEKSAGNKFLVAELVERGVSENKARELIASTERGLVAAKIEEFDWLTEKKRIKENPGGYLYQSIREKYATPKGFEPRAEREAKARAKDESRRRRDEERQKKENEQEAEWQAKRHHIDSYLGTLNEKERESLVEEALDGTSRHKRETAGREGTMGETARQIVIDEFVLQIHPMPAD